MSLAAPIGSGPEVAGLQIGEERPPFRWPEGTLTATLQVTREPLEHETVRPVEYATRIYHPRQVWIPRTLTIYRLLSWTPSLAGPARTLGGVGKTGH